MVVGDEGSGGAGLLGGLVVPDCCGEGEESLQDARGDAWPVGARNPVGPGQAACFVFVDEAIAAGRSNESTRQRVVSRVVVGSGVPGWSLF